PFSRETRSLERVLAGGGSIPGLPPGAVPPGDRIGRSGFSPSGADGEPWPGARRSACAHPERHLGPARRLYRAAGGSPALGQTAEPLALPRTVPPPDPHVGRGGRQRGDSAGSL